MSMPMAAPANQTICSNCHSTMPSELRFCRNCGFRLTSELGRLHRNRCLGPDRPFGSAEEENGASAGCRGSLLGCWCFSSSLLRFTALVLRCGTTRCHQPHASGQSCDRCRRYDQTDEGVSLRSVRLPNGPADKAGLIGGDLILSFDGQKIENEDQTRRPDDENADRKHYRR